MFWAKKKEPKITLEQAYKNSIAALEKQISVLKELASVQSECLKLQDIQIEDLQKAGKVYIDLVERGLKLNENTLSIVSLQEETIAYLREQLKKDDKANETRTNNNDTQRQG